MTSMTTAWFSRDARRTVDGARTIGPRDGRWSGDPIGVG